MLQRLGRYEVLETLAGGGQGTGDGEFDSAGDVAAASDGSVYVTDPFQHRIQKFTSEGVYISQWGSQGSGDGEFDFPFSVAVAPDNNIYVVDNNNYRIQKFNSEGVFISNWGMSGSGLSLIHI